MGIRVHQGLAILGDSPLRRARLEARLTLGYLAARVGVTPAAVNRWEFGQREPDRRVFLTLAVTGLEREHADWLREHRPRKCSVPIIAIALPAGLDAEAAQRICTDALVSLVTAQAANP